jgi:hypothetical protein
MRGAGLPAGGAWHHVAVGTLADEITAVSELLDEAVDSVRARELALLDPLRAGAERADDCHDLTHCIVHPEAVNDVRAANDVRAVDTSPASRRWTS